MNESHREIFNGLGESRVRLMMQSGQILPHMIVDAYEWLFEREEESRAANDASHASQARMALNAANDARSASKDAKLAIKIATIGAIITAVGTVIALLAWLHPHAPSP